MEVASWLVRAASRRPSADAVNGLSYSALLARADAGARDLRARGVVRGDHVALALPAGNDFVVALHACWRAGAVAVPFDLREPRRPEGAAIVDAPLGDGPPADLLDVHDLAATAIVVHTSGSTGAPKPVELTFGNWLWSALGSGVALGVDRDERWLCPLPLTHVGGLSSVVRSAIYATSAVVLERWDTERVLGELRGEGGDDGATLVSLVPTTLRRLLDAGLEASPPRLRTVLLGGAPVPDALRSAPVPITETYGLTEACSQVTTGGPPLFCTRVRLTEEGEIVVSGPTVAGGGELFTGDLGAFDARGHLQVTGRRATTIVSGGENVAPEEVEAALETHPAVAEAFVHARGDAEWGEAVEATVVVHEDAVVTEIELRAHVAARLAPFKVPKAIGFASDLPRTASGKLRRSAS